MENLRTSTLIVFADDPGIGKWGPIWLAKKPNMAEGSEVTWGEMRLAKLAPRSSVYRDKSTVRRVLHHLTFFRSLNFLELLCCSSCFVLLCFTILSSSCLVLGQPSNL